MGNGNTQEIKGYVEIAKKRAEKIKRACNILIMGDQHHGKSSFINSIFRVVQTIDHSIHFQPAPAETTSERCTFNYKKYTLLDFVHLFDPSCFLYKTETKKQILLKLLKGIQENILLFDKKLENNPKLMFDQILTSLNLKENENLNNKIDFVIFIATPEDFFIRREGYIYDDYIINKDKLKDLRNIVDTIKVPMNDYPYVVFTHKDESTSKRNYNTLVQTVYEYSINAKSQTFLITNYKEREDKPLKDTDANIYCIFSQIIFTMNM